MVHILSFENDNFFLLSQYLRTYNLCEACELHNILASCVLEKSFKQNF